MFKFIHYTGNHMGGGEGKICFYEIHLPVFSCPFVNTSEPFPVNGAEIGCFEPVILIMDTNELSESAHEFPALHYVYFPLAFYTDQITKDSPP